MPAIAGTAFALYLFRAFAFGPAPGSRQPILVAAPLVLWGFYLVYHRGAYMRVLKNADKYGPFACVWMRPTPGHPTQKAILHFHRE